MPRGPEAVTVHPRVLILVVAGLLLTAPAAVADGNTLDFGLTVEAHSQISEALEMVPHDSGDSDRLLVEEGETLLWVADEAAQVDMNVESQTVTVNIDVSQVDELTDPGVTVEVGTYGEPEFGGFNPYGSNSATLQNGVYTADVLVNQHSIDGNSGEYLATQATFDGLTLQVVGSDQSSSDYEKEGPPNLYPTPELGSLLLTSLGLVGVVGATRFRRP